MAVKVRPDRGLHMGMPSVRAAVPDMLTMITDGVLRPAEVTTDTDRIDNAPNAKRRYWPELPSNGTWTLS